MNKGDYPVTHFKHPDGGHEALCGSKAKQLSWARAWNLVTCIRCRRAGVRLGDLDHEKTERLIREYKVGV